MVRPLAQGYWDPFLDEMRKKGVTVYDNRKRDKQGRFVKDYRRSTSADKTFGVHDSTNTAGKADPTNPALRAYDATFGSFGGKPYFMVNRFADQHRGAVNKANGTAGPQIAWAGPSGGTPTGRDAEIGRALIGYLQQNSPDMKFSGHGELYGHDPRYSRAGRDANEGSWRTAVLQDAILPIAAEHQQPRLASGPTPAVRPPMALGGPQADTLPPVTVESDPAPARPVGPPGALPGVGAPPSLSPVGPPQSIQTLPAEAPGRGTINGGMGNSPMGNAGVASPAMQGGFGRSQSVPVGQGAPPPPAPNPQRTPQPQSAQQTWSQAMHQQMMGGPMMMPGQTYAPPSKNNALIGLLGGFF